MSEGGRWRGKLKAILRGLAAAIPVVGPAIAECLKHAEEAKLEAKIDALVRRVGRGDAGRTQTLAEMSEDEVERAVAEGVSRLSEADRARLTAVFEPVGSGALGAQVHEAVDGALSALADAPPVRHTLLSYACQRAGEGRLLAPGDRIDARYEVIELIGVGGMGAVYRARDLTLDEDVVVKFLRAELAGDAACARRFLQEAKVGLSLTHEGIVRIRDVRKTGETSYLTMEWVEGPTLRAFLGGGKRLTWGEAEPIAKGILSALAYAHAKGVLHLDLKPENVLLPRPDAPKLCDFGLARVVARPGGASLLPGAGTPHYMAPEQQRGGDLDARADVYAAGVLLYEMLAGELPMGVFEPLDGSVPVEIREMVQVALSQKRDKRPKDASTLLERISAEGPSAPAIPRAAMTPTSQVPARAPVAPARTVSGAPAADGAPVNRTKQYILDRIAKQRAGMDEAIRLKQEAEQLEAPREGRLPAPAASGGALRDAGLKYLQENAQGYEEYEDLKTGMVLIRVPAGKFEMGSDNGGNDERPVHGVILSEYLIGKFVVTNAQYRDFCRAKSHAEPPQPSVGSWYAGYFSDSQYDDYPVVAVTWGDAKAYCDWAGLRLPTEGEWEYAARGQAGWNYPWGNEEPDGTRANYDKKLNGGDYTRKVGSYPWGVSAFGALDMGGNVWEWCADWYGEWYYKEAPRVQDPHGPTAGSHRVVRGGSWSSLGGRLRAYSRSRRDPGGRLYFGDGFRVARSPAP